MGERFDQLFTDFQNLKLRVDQLEATLSGRVDHLQEWPSLAVVQGRYALRAVAHTQGNRLAASRILGVDRKTLERIIQRTVENSKDRKLSSL